MGANPFLSNPAVDLGSIVIEKYNFELAKLTEELDDALVRAHALVMFEELTDWLSTLPKFLDGTNKG